MTHSTSKRLNSLNSLSLFLLFKPITFFNHFVRVVTVKIVQYFFFYICTFEQWGFEWAVSVGGLSLLESCCDCKLRKWYGLTVLQLQLQHVTVHQPKGTDGKVTVLIFSLYISTFRYHLKALLVVHSVRYIAFNSFIHLIYCHQFTKFTGLPKNPHLTPLTFL